MEVWKMMFLFIWVIFWFHVGVYILYRSCFRKKNDGQRAQTVFGFFLFPNQRLASLPGKPASSHPNSIQAPRQVTMLTWHRDGQISWTGYLQRSRNLNSHGNAAAAAEFGMDLVMGKGVVISQGGEIHSWLEDSPFHWSLICAEEELLSEPASCLLLSSLVVWRHGKSMKKLGRQCESFETWCKTVLSVWTST